MMQLRRLVVAAAAAIAWAAAGTSTLAQDWPNRPITFVVGFGAGGANDLIARALAPRLEELLGTPIVVENRPGANSMLAMSQIARSQPDGYTIALAGATPLSINPHTQESLQYDPLKDFDPISPVAVSTIVMAVNPKIEATTLAELQQLAKSRPVSAASSGVGGIAHLAIEQFNTAANVKLDHVAYPGGAQAATDVVGGHVDAIFMDYSPLRPHIGAGNLRPIGIMSRERSALLPDVPTAIEQGFPDLIAISWFGVVTPAGTPDDILAKLHNTVVAAANSDQVREQLSSIGMEPMTMDDQAEFRRFIETELGRWGQIAAAAGVKKSSR